MLRFEVSTTRINKEQIVGFYNAQTYVEALRLFISDVENGNDSHLKKEILTTELDTAITIDLLMG